MRACGADENPGAKTLRRTIISVPDELVEWATTEPFHFNRMILHVKHALDITSIVPLISEEGVNIGITSWSEDMTESARMMFRVHFKEISKYLREVENIRAYLEIETTRKKISPPQPIGERKKSQSGTPQPPGSCPVIKCSKERVLSITFDPNAKPHEIWLRDAFNKLELLDEAISSIYEKYPNSRPVYCGKMYLCIPERMSQHGDIKYDDPGFMLQALMFEDQVIMDEISDLFGQPNGSNFRKNLEFLQEIRNIIKETGQREPVEAITSSIVHQCLEIVMGFLNRAMDCIPYAQHDPPLRYALLSALEDFHDYESSLKRRVIIVKRVIDQTIPIRVPFMSEGLPCGSYSLNQLPPRFKDVVLEGAKSFLPVHSRRRQLTERSHLAQGSRHGHEERNQKRSSTPTPRRSSAPSAGPEVRRSQTPTLNSRNSHSRGGGPPRQPHM